MNQSLGPSRPSRSLSYPHSQNRAEATPLHPSAWHVKACSIGPSPTGMVGCTPGGQAEVGDSLHVLQGDGGLALVGNQKGDRFALHARLSLIKCSGASVGSKDGVWRTCDSGRGQ